MRRPALLAFAAAAFVTPVRADDMGVCLKAERKVAIAACTRVIEAKRLTREVLALAYGERGIRYKLAGEYDLALADYNSAIRIEPTTLRYVDRAQLFAEKGDLARAKADYRQALALPATYSDGRWAHEAARKGLAALERRK